MVAPKGNCLTKTQKILHEHLSDRFWRLNNLYYILDEQGNKIKFVMNAVQLLLYRMLWWLNIIPKSRQHGITTFISLFMLDACLFNSDVRAGIIAHKLADAKKIFRDKIRYAYTHLPSDIRASCPLVKDDSQELLFANNSGIYVGTSMRSGTLQYLHISEYGWICTHAPTKASEIKTGAMETTHEGAITFIESTAEGPSGDFPDMCNRAEDDRVHGKELGKLDWRIHFFAWYSKASNVTDPKYVEISDSLHEYFDKVERARQVKITSEQRAWYTAKKKTLGNLIYKEHPSTLDEAFIASVMGSYYGDTFAWLYEHGRIGDVPHNPSLSTHVVCDPGFTSAWWLLQVTSTGYVHFLRYYEDTGRDFAYYSDVLKEWQEKYGYRYGKKLAPWDIDNNQYKLVHADGLLEIARRAGIEFKRMEVEKNVLLGIARTTQFLKMCRFDEDGCKKGIEKLKAYHEQINTQMSTEDNPVFTGLPAKDGNDHAADCMRYCSMALPLIESSSMAPEKAKDWRVLQRKYA